MLHIHLQCQVRFMQIALLCRADARVQTAQSACEICCKACEYGGLIVLAAYGQPDSAVRQPMAASSGLGCSALSSPLKLSMRASGHAHDIPEASVASIMTHSQHVPAHPCAAVKMPWTYAHAEQAGVAQGPDICLPSNA